MADDDAQNLSSAVRLGAAQNPAWPLTRSELVNLTAERDILNNTLEQTKRDLNREMSARAALENAGAGGGGRGGKAAAGTGKKGGVSMVLVLIIAMAAALGGIKLANSGAADFLESVPVLGSALDFGEDDASSGAVAKEEL